MRPVAQVSVWAVAFATVLYLGLSDGGYDLLVWAEIGVGLWWLLLLGALCGLLPVAGLGRTSWIAIALLGAFTLWSAVGIDWAASSERGAAELARVTTYLGAFALSVAAAERGYARPLLDGVTAAVALIGGVALLSRLHPAWFPLDEGARFLAEQNRLSYPLNYFNALAAMLALGLVLCASAAARARTLPGQALAAGAIPALVLALDLTLSRGGVLALVVGACVLVALVPERLSTLLALVPAALGGVALILAENGLERDVLLALVLVVCLGVGVADAALRPSLSRAARQLSLRFSRRQALAAAAGGIALAAVLFVSLGGAGELSDRWSEFKERDPALEGTSATAPLGRSRLTRTSSRGRYQIWQSALDANRTARLRGIGPGGFEFWWARQGRLETYFRDGHSLYFDTLADLGIVGLLLVAGFVGFTLVAGSVRAVRHPARRTLIAAAVAGSLVFALTAAYEWIWQVSVLPVVFMALAGIAVAARGPGQPSTRRPRWAGRLLLAAIAVAALVAILPPLVATAEVRASEHDVAASRLGPALEHARTAERVQPYAASPKLQEAFVHERRGELAEASDAARAATEAESENWRPWLVLSRIEARRGHARAARAAYRRARSLNPRSVLFRPD
jgi:O-antigen ligase/polysaccharide polymerase Wzy-like membrane protein